MEAAAAVASAIAAAATSTTGVTLAVIGSLASVGMGIAGSMQQAEAARNQAAQANFQARQEEAKGRSDQLAMRRQLVQALASNSAAYAGRGVALDDGTPGNVADALATEAAYRMEIGDTNAALGAEGRRRQADALNARADAALLAGIGGAVGGLGQLGMRLSANMPGSTGDPWKAKMGPLPANYGVPG